MNTLKAFKLFISASIFSCIFFFSSTSYGQTSQERGLQISREAKERDAGWVDMQAVMIMTLRNKLGEEDTRVIRTKSLEQENDGDKSLTIFEKPKDIKGTAFLNYSHALKADEQWLYLPSLKRVKRISSKNKSGPFMGSEFAYEDLSSFEIEKYTYKYHKEEACDLGQCFVIEQYPVDKRSGYTRRIVWIDKDAYRIDKIEFYDRKNSSLKTLIFQDYKKYQDKYWRAHTQNMLNHQNGKATVLMLSDIRFKTGLADGDFNRNALKRAR